MKSPDSFVPLTAATTPAAPREYRVAILNGNGHNGNGNGNGHKNGNHGSNGNNGSNGNGHANGNGNGNGNGDGQGVVAAGSFQSLESARPLVMNHSNGSNGADKKICEPRVTVQREGDRVTHLRIQCTCGQVMELACVYDPPARQA